MTVQILNCDLYVFKLETFEETLLSWSDETCRWECCAG